MEQGIVGFVFDVVRIVIDTARVILATCDFEDGFLV